MLLAGPAAALAACHGAAHWSEQADHDVYEILAEKRAEVGAADPFTIDPPTDTLRERLLAGPPEVSLDLLEALRVAAENSREWQDRREALYAVALALTLERWNYSVHEKGTIGAFLEKEAPDAKSAGARSNLNLVKLFASGLLLTADAGLDFVRDVGTGDGWDAVTHLRLNLTQPLMRGFGRDIVLEPLTQAERDVIYEARVYERFRHTFSVDVAERFFRVLELQDRLANEEQNHANLIRLRERNEALAEAGRLTTIQLDQARQEELSAQDQVITARRNLQTALDDFKFFLGLPIETELALEEDGKRSLDAWEELFVEFDEETVVALALERRLEHLTAVDRVVDAERKVEVAADALRAGLDLGVTGQADSEEGKPASFDADDFTWSVNLDFDAPIDRLPERNAYRLTQIAWELRKREETESADRIRAELRDSIRNLAAARESYSIQSGAVVLAERRAERDELNLDAGRADTRDVLEAQEALVGARNDAVSALTDYILAGIFLYRDMELIQVTNQGIEVDSAALRTASERGASEPEPPEPDPSPDPQDTEERP